MDAYLKPEVFPGQKIKANALNKKKTVSILR